LGHTTVFELAVLSPECPAILALADTRDRKSKLSVLYDFRGRVLERTPAGQRHIKLFYRHAAEAVWLMQLHPELRSRSRALLEQFLPTFQAVLAQKPATLTPANLASIDSLLAAFAKKARPALRADINSFRKELRHGALLRQLGIRIVSRSPDPRRR
jgi:hypothetical protein